jgi:DNA-binding response OmpR family regulator
VTNILIAEDEEDIRELLLIALGDAGFDIIEAVNGDAASIILESFSPALLLTNINMPGRLSGIGLARLARKLHPSMPVLFITGRPDELERASAFGPPSGVLAKPFRLADIVEAVQRFIRAAEDQ